MPNYALINNGEVVNVVVAETIEDAKSVTGFDVHEFPDDAPFRWGKVTKFVEGKFFLEEEIEAEAEVVEQKAEIEEPAAALE